MSTNQSSLTGPPNISPSQRLILMNDVEWENFILSCVQQLKNEGKYIQVIRLGNAGDKGRDVCGYTNIIPQGNDWDLYQAKHYQSTLSPSNFAPELAKFLFHAHIGSYPIPRRYNICTLKVGTSLQDLIKSPEKFKTWILEQWTTKKGDFGQFKKDLTPALETFIKGFPFEIIQNITPLDLLDIHKNSPDHFKHFGVIPPRTEKLEVPDIIGMEEEVYIEALLDVYREEAELAIAIHNDIPDTWKIHFKTQRQLFYSAESLNRFSRDKLPGAFQDLLKQLELGISTVVQHNHATSMIRLYETLKAANTISVNNNPLTSRLEGGDLQGGCHQLVNQKAFNWKKS